MPDADIPYTPIGSPVVEYVPYKGLNFKTVVWKAATSPKKGTIVYVHGFCEHALVYTEFFDRVTQKGYEIFFFDQRGAGETSPGKWKGKTDEFHTYDDLDFMIERVLAARTDKSEKIFLAGHSMGGGIVLNYPICGKYRDELRGVFVSGPLIELHPSTRPNWLLMKLQPVINTLVPGFKIDSKIKYDYITSNDGWRAYISSTDKHLVGTIRQINDMFKRGWKLREPSHVQKWKADVPLLVFHGTEDEINDIAGTEKFFKLVPESVDREFVSVSGSKHSVFIEKEEIVANVIEKVLEFLGKH